jgi:hypothetical protein
VKPIWTAPRDGRWVRLYATRTGVTSLPVRWCARSGQEPGWYSARGEGLAVEFFDAWLPVKKPRSWWRNVLGVDGTAMRSQIRPRLNADP